MLKSFCIAILCFQLKKKWIIGQEWMMWDEYPGFIFIYFKTAAALRHQDERPAFPGPLEPAARAEAKLHPVDLVLDDGPGIDR